MLSLSLTINTEDASKKLDLYSRKMARSKSLLSLLVQGEGDHEAKPPEEIIPYNSTLVSVLIAMLSQDGMYHHFPFFIDRNLLLVSGDANSLSVFGFLKLYLMLLKIGLLATGENRLPIQDEHTWQLQVFFTHA